MQTIILTYIFRKSHVFTKHHVATKYNIFWPSWTPRAHTVEVAGPPPGADLNRGTVCQL